MHGPQSGLPADESFAADDFAPEDQLDPVFDRDINGGPHRVWLDDAQVDAPRAVAPDAGIRSDAGALPQDGGLVPGAVPEGDAGPRADAGADAGRPAPDGGTASPSDGGRAPTPQDAAAAPDTATPMPCAVPVVALDAAVARCFALARGETFCLRLTLADERARSLSVHAQSLSQREAREGVRCTFEALRGQCLQSQMSPIWACYTGK